MNYSIVLFSIVCILPFFTSANDVTNICAFSSDPSKYSPKCYTCDMQIMPNAMQACMNATSMPKNISFSSADCMEKNCGMVFPEPPTKETEQLQGANPFADLIRFFLPPQLLPYYSASYATASARRKRSVGSESMSGTNSIHEKPKYNIVAQVETFVVDNSPPVEFKEIEYEQLEQSPEEQ